MKIYYTLADDGMVTLDKIIETHVVYEDLVVPEDAGGQFKTDDSDSADDFEVHTGTELSTENTSTKVEDTTTTVEEPTEQPTNDTLTTTTVDDVTFTGTVENTTTATVATITSQEVSASNEDKTTEEASSTASFTESERAELEKLKREKKITLIKNYEKYLNADQLQELTDKVDEMDEVELENTLLKIYKEYQDNEDNFSQTIVPFAVPEPQKKETAETLLNSYIRRMLGK
jgi:hypothetical protein